MSWFSELIHPGNTVNQTQTYTPNPYASGAITSALGQAQNVAQTPFQTPVAPVAGFSGQQNQAFDLANGIPGAAMPYIQEGADYLRGQGTENFYNPMAANVMAGLKDIFGQQMSDTTGKLQQSAGGVGADRIAVGQSELAKEQGLSAGQTLSNLWQQALSASQNAGYGLANMGNLAQNSQLQGLNALLTTGGLQQQQQQAQLNAPYQNELARIQWPYQNAQFLSQITGALAPGLGGTTTGQTQYPQQSPLGTIAGLGMAGAGAYGASGGFGGGDAGNWMTPNYSTPYVSPAYDAATNTINPNYKAARGGRINSYADGGAVDDNMFDAEQGHDGQWEIPGGHPINVMEHSLVPQGQIPQIQPHIPQLQAPQQQGGGGLGSLVGMAAKVLSMIPAAQTGGRVPSYANGGSVPAAGMLGGGFAGPPVQTPQPQFGQAAGMMNQSGNPLAQAFGGMFGGMPQGGGMPQQGGNPFAQMFGGMGGQMGGQNPIMQALMALRSRFGGQGQGQPQQRHFADGGAVDEDPGLEGLRRATEAMDITRLLGSGPAKNGMPPMMDWTMALMGLRPSGIGLKPLPSGNNRMQIRGQFQKAGTPITNHPAQAAGPAYLGANAMANTPGPRRASRFFEDPEQGGMGKGMGPEEPPASFDERFGPPGGGGGMAKEMAPEEPAASFADRFAAMPERAENPYAAAPEPAERVPLPRAVVKTPQKKKRTAEILDELSSRPQRPFIGHASGFAEGGEVEDEFDPPLFLRSGMEEVPAAPSRPRSQFEAKPLGGNKAALATDLANARYLRDNPGKTLGAVPSVVGNIVGSAIENRREPGPQQMGAPRRQEKTWLPGVGNIFDMSANAAEAEHDPRPTEPKFAPDEREAGEIARINGLITAERAKLEVATKMRVATDNKGKPIPSSESKRLSAMEAAKAGIAAYQTDLDKLEGPQSAFGLRRATGMSGYNDALRRWEERQEKLAGRKVNAGQPYAVKFPEWQEGMQKWSAPASAGTGAVMGTLGALKGHPLKAALGAGLMGAGEGVYASLWPTLQDAEHLPPGSEHNKGAIARLYEGDPDTWRRAGVGAMTHGPLALGTSLLTSHVGEIGQEIGKRAGRGVAATARGLGNVADWWRRAPAPSSAAGNTLPAAPARMRTAYTDQSGNHVGTFYPDSGKWRGPGGQFMKKADYPDPKKHKAGKPESYALGGSVDFEDQWDPTTKAIQDGTFDPQGENFPSGIAPFARTPMPRANPFRPEPEEDGSPLTAQAAAGPVGPKPIPRQALLSNASGAAPRSQNLADNPWMALVSAGLGTMASAGQRDARGLPMSPLAAIGHGGQQGIKQLETQREAAMKQQSLEQAAKRLEQQAAQQERHLTETERHNKSNEQRQKEAMEFQKGRLGVGLFDPETTNMMAEQALTGDKSVFANLGRGVSGPQNIVQVRQRMNELAKERGFSGRDIAALNANFAAQTAAVRTTAVREANIATAVEEAKGTFPLALAASGNLSRTDYTPINKLMAAVRSGTSSPEQAEFALAHQAVITAYSQAMSRTGANTVHAQERAEKAFSDVQSHESYERAIQQLNREMAVALVSPEKAREIILSKITGKKTTEEPASTSPTKKEFTGRTATHPTTKKQLREKSDGTWVE